MAMLWIQRHTQYRGAGRSDRVIVGTPMVPAYALRTTGFLLLLTGMLTALGGFFQINPVWLYGPYQPWDSTSFAQPDWYTGWLEGAVRMTPAWDIHIGGFLLPGLFWPAALLPGVIAGFLFLWPWLDAVVLRDNDIHNVLQTPRDRPGRTAHRRRHPDLPDLLLLAGGDDVFAATFHWHLPTLLAVMQGLTLGMPFVVGGSSTPSSAIATLPSPTRSRRELGRRRRPRSPAGHCGAARIALALRVSKPRIVALFALTVLVATLLAGPVGAALTSPSWRRRPSRSPAPPRSTTTSNATSTPAWRARFAGPRQSGALAPRAALMAGLLATGGGVAAVWACGGPAAAAFAAGGAFYYVIVYTLLIKPRIAFSSLPGSLAGVFPALIGWTAAGGGLSGRIVFAVRADRGLVAAPLLGAVLCPLRRVRGLGHPHAAVALGERAATRLIFAAGAVLVALSLAPSVAGLYPPTFLVTAVPAGVALLAVAGTLALRRRRATALLLHKLSGPYLAALLVAMVIERLARP